MIASCHATAKDAPSLESALGAAPLGNARIANRPDSSINSSAVGDQPGSRIVPACPAKVANACVTETIPKFASGNGMQSPLESQDEGAWAIHSAADKSADPERRVARPSRCARHGGLHLLRRDAREGRRCRRSRLRTPDDVAGPVRGDGGRGIDARGRLGSTRVSACCPEAGTQDRAQRAENPTQGGRHPKTVAAWVRRRLRIV